MRNVPATSHDRPAGQQWDDVWASVPDETRTLFTRRRPATLIEFIQRCYAEDLLGLMASLGATAHCCELGSGRGTTSMYLADRGYRVTLVDRSANALHIARGNFAALGLPRPLTVMGDATACGLRESSFDCVYNIGLLEHFEDPAPVLRESSRLLRPGGLLFSVVVPDVPESRKWLVRLIFRPWSYLPATWRDEIRTRLAFRPPRRPAPRKAEVQRVNHSRESYVGWCQAAGFSRVHCVPYNPYHTVSPRRLERTLALPAYRIHRRIKLGVGQAPAAMTLASVAWCDLLYAWR